MVDFNVRKDTNSLKEGDDVIVLHINKSEEDYGLVVCTRAVVIECHVHDSEIRYNVITYNGCKLAGITPDNILSGIASHETIGKAVRSKLNDNAFIVPAILAFDFSLDSKNKHLGYDIIKFLIDPKNILQLYDEAVQKYPMNDNKDCRSEEYKTRWCLLTILSAITENKNTPEELLLKLTNFPELNSSLLINRELPASVIKLIASRPLDLRDKAYVWNHPNTTKEIKERLDNDKDIEEMKGMIAIETFNS